MAQIPEPGNGDNDSIARRSEDDRIRDVRAWVVQLARTLKTCRLYETENPAVERFREDLIVSLLELLDSHGTVRLRFGATSINLDDDPLMEGDGPGQDLAFGFYRDGVRSLTLMPGIEPDEVDALVDALLEAGSRAEGADDLVTRLWESDLPNVALECVPAGDDLGLEGDAADKGEGSPAPWPGLRSESHSKQLDEVGERSDDWIYSSVPDEAVATFEGLDVMAATLVEGFLDDYQSDHERPLAESALDLITACLDSEVETNDYGDLAAFLLSVTRIAVDEGRWATAGRGLTLHRRIEEDPRRTEGLARELALPAPVHATAGLLECGEEDQVRAFLRFARDLGPSSVDWLCGVLAQCQHPAVRLALVDAVAELCKESPHRLAHWMIDPRWYVVRNVVSILGKIPSPESLELARAGASRSEPPVLLEIVHMAGAFAPADSLPLLHQMLATARTRVFRAIVEQMEALRDPDLGDILIQLVRRSDFDERPPDERDAVFAALGSLGGERVVGDLADELGKGGLFMRTRPERLAGIAFCLARIGGDSARDALEQGARSKRGALRRICRQALLELDGHGS